LHLVKADTVGDWQGKGFRISGARVWQRKKGGGPPASSELRAFIPRLGVANPYGGAPRLHGELLKLGRAIAERTVSRFMPKKRKRPSPDLEGFPEQPCSRSRRGRLLHRAEVSFRVLLVFVVVAYHRRRMVHFNVTEHPTVGCTGQRGWRRLLRISAPGYLLRDRDQISGYDFRGRVKSLSLEEVLRASKSRAAGLRGKADRIHPR
jgi:hypothetical protein